MKAQEQQYLDLLQEALDEGDPRMDRTGVGTRSLFARSMTFDLSGGHVPLFTTKKVAWRTAIRELLWFLSGETNIRPLVLQGVHIWTDWPLASFRRSHPGMSISRDQFEDWIKDDPSFAAKYADLGPTYGSQWRHWRGNGAVYDQISTLVKTLRTNPTSRRMLFTAWNVADLEMMALPPCHVLYQYHVQQGRKLNCAVYQRSADLVLGLPFNVFEAAVLQYMLAQQTGLTPGRLTWFGGDVHLYENHVNVAIEQLLRRPRPVPILSFTRCPESLFDYTLEDFRLLGYEPYPALHAPVAV
ncbi:MAG TPA: thymidylate synthase [Nevskiaceae bacterium]|nr:thymidylate synthase [Nevskiaceae bacterium]